MTLASGIVEEHVVISGRCAALLAGPLDMVERYAKVNRVRLDDEVAHAIASICQLGTVYRTRTAANGSARLPQNTEFGIMPAMSTKDAARRLGCGERNVRDLAARGRLPGRRAGSGWSFDPVLVDEYAATRRPA